MTLIRIVRWMIGTTTATAFVIAVLNAEPSRNYVAPASAPNSLDAAGYAAAAAGNGNDLAYATRFAGRTVETNAILQRVRLEGGTVSIVFTMTDDGGSMVHTGADPTCHVDASPETAPIGRWEPWQRLRVTARLGTQRGSLDDCRMVPYAFVDQHQGTLSRVFTGDDWRPDASQGYPPPGFSPARAAHEEHVLGLNGRDERFAARVKAAADADAESKKE